MVASFSEAFLADVIFQLQNASSKFVHDRHHEPVGSGRLSHLHLGSGGQRRYVEVKFNVERRVLTLGSSSCRTTTQELGRCALPSF